MPSIDLTICHSCGQPLTNGAAIDRSGFSICFACDADDRAGPLICSRCKAVVSEAEADQVADEYPAVDDVCMTCAREVAHDRAVDRLYDNPPQDEGDF
jgi:predicted amidophosphoribosyltransferase